MQTCGLPELKKSFFRRFSSFVGDSQEKHEKSEF